MSSTSILLSKYPYSLTAENPLAKREGLWLCHWAGVDPNQVTEVRHVYDFATNQHLFEFIAHEYGIDPDEPWPYEVDAELPKRILTQILHQSRWVTDEALLAATRV